MHELGRYRTPAKRCAVTLCCPACEETFYVAEPDAEVSVAPCPHGDCQVVCIVSWMKPPGSRGRWEAVAFEAFARARRPDLLPAALIGYIVVFLMLPIWMWVEAWSRSFELWAAIAIQTTPALIVGVLAVVFAIFDVIDELRAARREFIARRRAIRRASWIETRERSE